MGFIRSEFISMKEFAVNIALSRLSLVESREEASGWASVKLAHPSPDPLWWRWAMRARGQSRVNSLRLTGSSGINKWVPLFISTRPPSHRHSTKDQVRKPLCLNLTQQNINLPLWLGVPHHSCSLCTVVILHNTWNWLVGIVDGDLSE